MSVLKFIIEPLLKHLLIKSESNRDQGACSLAVPVSRQSEAGHVTAPAVDLAVGPVIDLEFKIVKSLKIK